MEIYEILLKEFKNQQTKYYDEGVLESQIIKLESLIIKNLGTQKGLYDEIKKSSLALFEMVELRLIEFVIEKLRKKKQND